MSLLPDKNLRKMELEKKNKERISRRKFGLQVFGLTIFSAILPLSKRTVNIFSCGISIHPAQFYKVIKKPNQKITDKIFKELKDEL